MNRTNLVVGVVFFLFSLVYYFYLIPTQIILSTSESEFAGRIFRPETFPQITIALFGLISVLLAGNALRERGALEVMPGLEQTVFFSGIFRFHPCGGLCICP